MSNWKLVGSSGYNCLAIKTDGTLWAWGQNTYGSIGINNTNNYSSPVQIGTLSNWKTLSTDRRPNISLAIKTDGTLWSWGRNAAGELGLGDTIPRSSPVQVGTLGTWAKISQWNVQVSAIKTDGTLWAWGSNGFGYLGDGTTTDRSSPVQVGSLTNWKSVNISENSANAVKTDGTLWAWGYVNTGQAGLGTTISYSSPVQVGLLTNWKSSGGGSRDMYALTFIDI